MQSTLQIGAMSSQSLSLSGLTAAIPNRDVFLRALTQTARLLSIVTPLPDAALVVERMQGSESVSAPFRFEIDCLSTNAHFSLARFIGEEVTLRILLADGRSTRSWHGLITAAAQLGADGGLARYRLTIEPWLAYLAQRRNSRIFQDKSAQDILSDIFADYPLASFEFSLSPQAADQIKPRSYTAQYRETDLAFMTRILASEGLSYRFEHQQDSGAGKGTGGGEKGSGARDAELAHTRHKLVIFDAGTEAPICPQALIRYHRNSATEASDTLQLWQTRQQLMTNTVTRASWDYKQLLSPADNASVDATSFGGLGQVPELEDYDASGAYRYDSVEAAQRAATLRAQYLALAMQTQRIGGSVRVLDAGQQFTVTQHPIYHGDQARFTVLAVEHEAANNLDSDAKLISGFANEDGSHTPIERGTYRNRAVCVAAALPVVPLPQAKPAVPGLQTALVVGSSDATQGTGTHSERDGRVKVQFHWQRGERPNAGGLADASQRATGTDSNGTWVRVAEHLAGPNWGSSFTPRVGSEVLVDFIEADIDRPLIVAQLYNGADAPPWPAGEGSGANHPGILAGVHAPTLDGSGWSQWQLDDATGQLRTRLATSHTASQLNLGYLIHQAPNSSQRGAYRGQGFELRTDGWAVTRAAQGMLISTTARQNAASTQLDTAEVAGQMKAASDTAQRLSDAASQSDADPLARVSQIEAFRKIIHPAAAPADGSDLPDRDIKSFTAPAILMEAPASIAFATPQSSSMFAGEQLSATVQSDTQITAQHTTSLVSGEVTSLYTHAGGIKAIAANSPLSIQAHDGPLEILADQNVTVTSSNDEVHVLANSKIVLQAGQSSITLEGSNITFACPGNFTVKGASHVMAGGGSGSAEFPFLPSGSIGETATSMISPEPKPELNWIAISHRDTENQPMAGQKYKIHFEGGVVISGALDAKGQARHEGVPPKGIRVEYEAVEPLKDADWNPLRDLVAAAKSKLG